MSTTDAQVAAPSAAVAAEPMDSSAILASLNAEERGAWERTGNLPDRFTSEPTKHADPSPAAPAAPAPSDAKPADSSPADAKPADSSPADHGKTEKRPDPRATENRIPELLAERAQLRAETEHLRRRLEALERGTAAPPDAKSAAPSPASAQPVADPNDPEPKLEDFEKDPDKYPDPYTSHLMARSEWAARQEFRRLQAAERQRAEEHTREHAKVERATAFKERIDKEGGAVFLDGISPEVQSLRPLDALTDGERPTPLNALAQHFLVSPVGPQLMRHFSDHPEDLQRFGQMHPTTFLLEIGKLEARIEAGATKAEPKEPPTKTITDAPAPGTILGKRSTEPADEVEGALARGDYHAYERAADRRDLAAHGRR